ncbi:MAG: AlpA family phage regulatory protein [Acidovorax sp.]|uniref:helix-turn-helix transcriptional regulator n=1 Tax=Acidovorax sp. TaxID=1872122 RepID=UPI0022C94661|nr:AlpA family phage regulatory protein [Acidovorax sp.]MCZ8218243.1 AlpA family phage regulatory protein [Acidovorax sp.]
MNPDISNVIFGPTAAKGRPKNRRIHRKAAVCEMLDICPGTLDNMVAENLFVKPIKIGARCVGFVADEVEAWLEQRIAERDAKTEQHKTVQ